MKEARSEWKLLETDNMGFAECCMIYAFLW